MAGVVILTGEKRNRIGLNERIADILPALEYRRMDEFEDREAVMRMRHEGYAQSFSVPKGWTGFTDRYDQCANTHTFGIFAGDKLASTIRLGIVTPQARDSHAVDLYPDLLGSMLDRDAVLIDISRLVVDTQCAVQIPELPYVTFRAAAIACRHYSPFGLVSVIRVKHIPFYKRLFNGEVIGEPIYYEALDCELNLVLFTLEKILDDLCQRLPSLDSEYLERRQLFGPPELIPGIKPGKIAA